MFKDEYKKELDNLTLSDEFKQNTILLMQEKAAQISGEPQPEKIVTFPHKKLVGICASIAVCAVAVFAMRLNNIKMDRAKTESVMPELASVTESQPEIAVKSAAPYEINGACEGREEKTNDLYVYQYTRNEDGTFTAPDGQIYEYAYIITDYNNSPYREILANREDISYNDLQNENYSDEIYIVWVAYEEQE